GSSTRKNISKLIINIGRRMAVPLGVDGHGSLFIVGVGFFLTHLVDHFNHSSLIIVNKGDFSPSFISLYRLPLLVVKAHRTSIGMRDPHHFFPILVISKARGSPIRIRLRSYFEVLVVSI